MSTSEALMTDPTTLEGRAYWQERHDYEERLEQMGDTCRSCHAPVIWLEHVSTGKPAPIDAEPVGAAGNILVDLAVGTYRVTSVGDDRQGAIDRGEPLHTNHFATCPQSAAWKARAADATQAGQP